MDDTIVRPINKFPDEMAHCQITFRVQLQEFKRPRPHRRRPHCQRESEIALENLLPENGCKFVVKYD